MAFQPKLVSLTRDDLLSFIDTKPRQYRGAARTVKQKEKKAAFDKAEAEAVRSSLKVYEIVEGWLNDPLLDGVLVLEVLDMCSSYLGQKTFVKLGTNCTWQLAMANSSLRVGDLPSQTYYATSYCPTRTAIENYLANHRQLIYGPFLIWKKDKGLFSALKLLDVNLYDANRRSIPSLVPALPFTELLDFADACVLSSDERVLLRAAQRESL